MKNSISIEENLRKQLNRLLEVDPASPSGLRWKVTRGKVKHGSVAGTLRKDGYWQVYVSLRLYQNHRLVWALSNNQDPAGFQVDHIDGNPSNNNSQNLRLATGHQNQCNRRRPQVNNTSGWSGIGWRVDQGKWRVRIKVNHKEICIGNYDSLDKAIDARIKAESKYFGEFAPIRD